MLRAWWELGSGVSSSDCGSRTVASVAERNRAWWFNAIMNTFLGYNRLSPAIAIHGAGSHHRRLVLLVLWSSSQVTLKRVHVRWHQANFAEHEAQPSSNSQAYDMKTAGSDERVEQCRLESVHEGLVRQARYPDVTLGAY